jgi:NDP-hexose C3-ketoreductase / dTDP-4-oxo-2-deoxy-alpha-D-pentos-2-ene 2,3-reductase
VSEYVHLGRSGLRVSRLALGTMPFGSATDEREAHAILDRAFAAGINFIDTADVYGADPNRQVYGWQEGKGRSEEIVGRWLAGRRDEAVVATKVYGAMGEAPNDMRLSAKRIRQACDASLRRLRTDRIDVYMLHHVDRSTPWEEIWEALALLHQQGKVLYFGTSNHAGWQIVQGQEAARGRLGFVVEQSIYSLMERTIELEVLPACRAYGIGVVAYSPLNAGLLSGVLREREAGARTTSGRAAAGLADRREQLERFEAFCEAVGEEPAAVAHAWLLHQPGVTGPVVGARTTMHLDAAFRALEITLGEAELRALDDMFPGPGPAPEAYAW